MQRVISQFARRGVLRPSMIEEPTAVGDFLDLTNTPWAVPRGGTISGCRCERTAGIHVELFEAAVLSLTVLNMKLKN